MGIKLLHYNTLCTAIFEDDPLSVDSCVVHFNGLPVSTFNRLKEKLEISEKAIMETVPCSEGKFMRC